MIIELSNFHAGWGNELTGSITRCVPNLHPAVKRLPPPLSVEDTYMFGSFLYIPFLNLGKF